MTLGQLGERRKITSNSVLYVPPLAHPNSPLTLANIMARLRAPVGGCPWDLEQTHESITRALVEETYEVIEAISDKDAEHLKEELGDLFLHVLFQTQIARDENEFSLSDVGTELAAKLIRRHPHVFGDEQAEGAGWVLDNWEKIKQAEKKKKGQSEKANRPDAGIPRNLPALTRAQKIAERVRRRTDDGGRTSDDGRGTDDRDAKGQTSNVKPQEFGRRDVFTASGAKEELLGDWLMELARLGEEYGIDAERALNAASNRLAAKK
jgi:MazG family protein